MVERKRAIKIGRLRTVMEVAAELGKIYRDARHEKIEAAFANRLANILTAMRQCLETAEFERRIAEIELAVSKSMSRFTPSFDPTREGEETTSDETDRQALVFPPPALPNERCD